MHSCVQAKLRCEMEMERMRHAHQKELESKDEEVEEMRQSCQKKVNGFTITLCQKRFWPEANFLFELFCYACCDQERSLCV